jgi:hypothetical protein
MGFVKLHRRKLELGDEFIQVKIILQ